MVFEIVHDRCSVTDPGSWPFLRLVFCHQCVASGYAVYTSDSLFLSLDRLVSSLLLPFISLFLRRRNGARRSTPNTPGTFHRYVFSFLFFYLVSSFYFISFLFFFHLRFSFFSSLFVYISRRSYFSDRRIFSRAFWQRL